jgi:hypothetical protein
MPLVLSGSVDISGSMTATTILVSAPGAGGMVSSSQQIQNYNLFAVTSSANTFYGNQSITGSLDVRGTAGNGIKLRHSNGTNIAEINELSGVQGAGLALKNSSGTQNVLFNAGGNSYINGGNLGVGTNDPFSDTGFVSTYIGGSSGGQLILGLTAGGSGNRYLLLQGDSGASSILSVGSRPLDIYTNSNVRMRITDAGQTQITGSLAVSGNSLLTGTLRTTSTNTFNGGTTYLGTTTFFRDDVSGAQNYGGSTIRVAGGTGTSAAGIQFGDVSTNTTGARGRIGFLASANNGNPKEFAIIKGVLDSTGANTCNGSLTFHTLNGDNATEAAVRMTIDGSGNIGAASGTNIYNASDARLKQNISSISGSLDSVLALNPVKFNWVDDFVPSENGKDMLGFVAQEVQTIVPEAVESFGANSIFVGETEIDNPLRVNEKFLIPVLTKAIQEQQAIIDSLIARIEALENN